MTYIEQINNFINARKEDTPGFSAGEVSDTYHTFDELYHHRMVLTAALFNAHGHLAWKSKLHHDGTMFDGMFIAGIQTPEGAFSYHYDIADWDKFKLTELERGVEWDGHTAADVTRLLSLEN